MHSYLAADDGKPWQPIVEQERFVKVPFIIKQSTGSMHLRRSQSPRGLRRSSAAARLLRLWVRIPPGAWMFVVSVMCCQVEVSATN